MTVPTEATYSVAAKIAAHTAFRDLLDAGAGAGSIKIRDAADVLLAEVPLAYPCGEVSPITGQLVIYPGGPDDSANATGTAKYAEFCDSNGLAHLSLPAVAGSSPVNGAFVIYALAIVLGGEVEVLSATVG